MDRGIDGQGQASKGYKWTAGAGRPTSKDGSMPHKPCIASSTLCPMGWAKSLSIYLPRRIIGVSLQRVRLEGRSEGQGLDLEVRAVASAPLKGGDRRSGVGLKVE